MSNAFANLDIPGMNEKVVYDYFARRGFVPERLDNLKIPYQHSACEWLVKSVNFDFLCEVKTITSVHRGAKTQDEFRRRFDNQVRSYFGRKKAVQNLPYHLHFHGSTLTVPSDKTLHPCLENISKLMTAIQADKNPQPFWMIENICEGNVDLVITHSMSGHLEIEVSYYGDLNTDSIEQALGEAIRQLKTSGIEHPRIARLAIMSFVDTIHITTNSEVVVFDGLAFHEKRLWQRLNSILKRNSALSAIAVMRGQTPPQFFVLHNAKITDVESLDWQVFADGDSTQYNSDEPISESTPQPLDVGKLVNHILETARKNSNVRPITLADYSLLKGQEY